MAGEREQRVVADQVSRELSDGASGGTMGLQIDVLLVAGGDGETLLRQRRGDGVLAILVGADLPLLRVTLIGGVALILTDGHVGAVAQFRRRATWVTTSRCLLPVKSARHFPDTVSFIW